VAAIVCLVRETLIVGGLLLLFALSGGATLAVPWQWLMLGGAALLLIGGLVGLPAGLYYHVVLRRHLARRGALPQRWWVQPTQYHPQFEDWERRQMMPYFRAGAVGFVVMMLGCLVAALGVMMA